MNYFNENIKAMGDTGDVMTLIEDIMTLNMVVDGYICRFILQSSYG